MSKSPVAMYYDVMLTDIGVLAVTITDNGLRFIKHYDTIPAARIDTLLRLTPARRDEARVKPYMQAVFNYLNGTNDTLDIKLDLTGGTKLQRKVWDELLKIPYGTTISYSDLATRVKKPSAVRAVASACGKNPIPLIIPCHRVVGKNGGLGGFAWGLETKQHLHDLEGIAAA